MQVARKKSKFFYQNLMIQLGVISTYRKVDKISDSKEEQGQLLNFEVSESVQIKFALVKTGVKNSLAETRTVTLVSTSDWRTLLERLTRIE